MNINIASLARAGTANVDLRIDFLQAMEVAKIDRAETCYRGIGFMHIDDLVEYMAQIDEMCDETPW